MIFGKHVAEMEKLEIAVRDKDKEISSLKAELEAIKKEIDGIKKERYSVISECSFEIDFKGFNVFSIEREEMPREENESFDREITSIGYFQDGKVNEWVFYCSRETHEKIARQFREYIRLKNQA